MRPAAALLTILCAGLLLGAGGGFSGATLYVNRIVVAPQGNVSLGALVRSSGPLAAEAREALSRSATVLGDSLQYLPVSQYQAQLDAAFGTDAILVGSWSMIVAQGTSAEAEGYLLSRLADFLISQNLLADSRVDMSFTLASLRGNPPEDGTPSFQVVKTVRGAEVSFSLAGSDGSSVAGRVTLAPRPDDGSDTGPTAGVKTNSAVRVVFRRGPITVEMPGRALESAAVGQIVSVYVPDSRKTFTGRVREGKAVQVDLP
jgi:hypothetical protein